jgi:nucleoid DNA-binding protein
MAQIDVAACIAVLLTEQGQVEVPGLGMFSGTRQPAQIDPFLQLAFPPRLGLTFHPEVPAGSTALYLYAAKRYAVSLRHAEDEVREYVQTVQNQLGDKEVVVLPQIGCLRRDVEGRLQFEQESTNLNIGTFGLPEVPAVRSGGQYMGLPTETPAQEEEKERVATPVVPLPAPPRQRPALPFVVVLGALIVGVGAYVLFRPHVEALFLSAKRKESNARMVEVAPGGDAADTAATVYEPGDSALAARQKLLLPDEHPDTCVIAIGLFRDPRNVARLLKKIEEAGLEPYSETKAGQTRVGVRFPYTAEAEVAGHLALVQSKLEPSAFVLLK